MEGAFSGNEHESDGPDAGSAEPRRAGGSYHPSIGRHARSYGGLQTPDSDATGFLPFLDRVLDNEDKTRRLGYLVRQVGLVIVAVLIALATVSYIVMYKSPLEVKIGVAVGSTLLIIAGRFWSVSRWARRQNAAPETHRVPRVRRSRSE